MKQSVLNLGFKGITWISHAKGAELDLTFATDGMAIPFHPGAAKYFAEKGITVDTGK